MRFLADENITHLVAARLTAAGFDVVEVATAHSGASDAEVLAVAVREGRILITEDRDFGELVIRQRLPVPGVVLLELDRLSNMTEANAVVAVMTANVDRLSGALTVIEPGRVRFRPLAG